jgi:hypothetical protein
MRCLIFRLGNRRNRPAHRYAGSMKAPFVLHSLFQITASGGFAAAKDTRQRVGGMYHRRVGKFNIQAREQTEPASAPLRGIDESTFQRVLQLFADPPESRSSLPVPDNGERWFCCCQGYAPASRRYVPPLIASNRPTLSRTETFTSGNS